MTYAPLRSALACILLAASLTGCGPSPGAKTPKELVERFVKAADGNRKGDFLSCFDLSGDEGKKNKEILELEFESMQAERSFQKTVMEKFKDDEKIKSLPDFVKTDHISEIAKKLDSVKITETGDKATATFDASNSKKPFAMIKKDGRWYADLSNMPKNRSPDKMRKELETFKKRRQALDHAKTYADFEKEMEKLDEEERKSS